MTLFGAEQAKTPAERGQPSWVGSHQHQYRGVRVCLGDAGSLAHASLAMVFVCFSRAPQELGPNTLAEEIERLDKEAQAAFDRFEKRAKTIRIRDAFERDEACARMRPVGNLREQLQCARLGVMANRRISPALASASLRPDPLPPSSPRHAVQDLPEYHAFLQKQAEWHSVLEYAAGAEVQTDITRPHSRTSSSSEDSIDADDIGMSEADAADAAPAAAADAARPAVVVGAPSVLPADGGAAPSWRARLWLGTGRTYLPAHGTRLSAEPSRA